MKCGTSGILRLVDASKMKSMIFQKSTSRLKSTNRDSSSPLPGRFITFSVDWKFLIIALMVEMGIFTALALFLKPLH